jgi:hypothetical protein
MHHVACWSQGATTADHQQPPNPVFDLYVKGEAVLKDDAHISTQMDLS